nr:TRAP transporter substrate-binding protein DctP [uncultured Enterobacter sp.]
MSYAKHGLTLILSALLLSPAAFAARTLTYSDHEPLNNMRTRFFNEVFFSEIEKASQGRLKVDAHWNGELSVSYNALETVRDGRAADMAVVVPEYTPDALPLHQIFKSFPLGPNTGDKQIAFFRQAYADIPALSAELDNNNVVKLMFGIGYPVAFFSTQPLTSLADLKNGKWRSASSWHKSYLLSAGAIPVSTPWGEPTAAALRNATVNGLMVNMDSGADINAERIAPYVLTSQDLWLGHVYLVVMNKNTWQSLAREDQQAILRAADIAYHSAGKVLDNSVKSMIAGMEKRGAHVRVLSPKELTAWETTTHYRDAQAQWVKEQQAKGVSNAGEVMEQIRTIVDARPQ